MNRLLIALIGAALIVGAFGLATMQSVSAQPAGPLVCLSLAPGEHTFTAPARDREGEVSFTVTVGDGGLVTGFTEPGGQSIPPAALLEIFAGDDAYPLPDGVTFIECEVGGDSMMGEAAPGLCLNLGPGSYDETVTAAGQQYQITINVGEGGRLIDVIVLGESYDPQQALDLLASFGASIPAHIQIVPCQPAMTDGGVGLPSTGSGGLADSTDRTALWAGLGSLTVLAIAVAALAHRRRVVVRNRD